MPTAAVPHPSPPTHTMVLALMTPEKTSTDPMERSMPAVMMTKVMPTPRIARIEAFWAMVRALPPLAKLFGARIENTMTIADQDQEDLEGLQPHEAAGEPWVGSFVLGVRGHGSGAAGLGVGAHAAASVAPVIAATSPSIEVSSFW